MTRCMWNPRYDRPSLGGEGDCTAEAVWEVGRKNILKLCERCVNLRPFVKWEKRRIWKPTTNPDIEEELESTFGEQLSVLAKEFKRIDSSVSLVNSALIELTDELREKGIIE